MNQLRQDTLNWLNSMTKGSNNDKCKCYSPFYHNFKDDMTGDSPFSAFAEQTYQKNEKSEVKPEPYPQSAHEGLQYAVNLCRINSKYNPLDVENYGQVKYFTEFTNLINMIPFISLKLVNTIDIDQKSTQPNQIIGSFVSEFIDIKSEDKVNIIKTVNNLANSALSYAGKEQKNSFFNQNVLSDNNSDHLSFYIYSSKFSIYTENNKGDIQYFNKYRMVVVKYELLIDEWNDIKKYFEEYKKASIQDWLKAMTTQPKENSKLIASCLN